MKTMEAGDDTQPGNPNKTPKRDLFGITQVRGRLRFILNFHQSLLGQHLNPLAGFHVWALQEDAAGTGSDQRLMGEVKNRMVG
jgi:hypothetical protein